MADAGANAYLMLFEMLKKEGRIERDKIAGLMWVRLAILLKSHGLIALSRDDLFELFENVIMNPTSTDKLREMEMVAGENDDNESGDFWATSVYLSKLVLENDGQYLGYIIDRYISCIEKIRVDVLSTIQNETDIIVNASLSLRSGQESRSEGLADYVRQALDA